MPATAQAISVPLTTLKSGCCATVHQRDMSGEDQELLSAMGLTDQCRLRICRVGEPCIIQIAATRLGLSKVMAGKIMVHPDVTTA
ncbi:MAG: FeoA family protein [Planctomycetota bacterium]|nr:FeoA family protein [Planctomycetota bacterium]